MTGFNVMSGGEFRLMLSAYKVRLYRAAECLGGPVETWGDEHHPIDIDRELAILGGEEKYRLAPYPFPGLRSFEPEEGTLFFGRERSVIDVRRCLERQRIVVVCGGSGSGKSSLIRAGLLPFLNTRQRIPGRAGNWYHVEFRPRTDPVRALSCAIADHLLLPFHALKLPKVAEKLGVPKDAKPEDAQQTLRDVVYARFKSAIARGSDAALQLLLDITGPELDRLDWFATKGLRSASPSVLLLLDQFEEVFRPEVAGVERTILLDLIVNLQARLTRPGDENNGLFLAVTMRSEELHRCAEHRNLSEVINRSLFLLELLDPSNKEDAKELRKAIVLPARRVFEDWGLKLDPKNENAPFAKNVPDWLIEGTKHLSIEIEHRPDQLPLLQHALQAMWHAAMRDWSRADLRHGTFEIRRDHLPGVENTNQAPELGACLRQRADRAAARSIFLTRKILGPSTAETLFVQRAAFRALARRDDRGNWARRFAKRDDIMSFLSAEPAMAGVPEAKQWEAAKCAVDVFFLRGYVSGGDQLPYDISHEALIRNWPQFQEWLREPGEVASALNRVMEDVEPEKFNGLTEKQQIDAIPVEISQRVARVARGGSLPAHWAADQIAPRLSQPTTRRCWGADERAALKKIVELSQRADKARADAAEREKKAQADAVAREQQAELDRRQRRLLAYFFALVVAFIVFLFYIYNLKQNEVIAARDSSITQQNSSIRELNAQSIIGAMQAEIVTQPWPPGGRESAALASFEMINGGGSQAPSAEVLRDLASEQWDAGVRSILGSHYTVRKFDDPQSKHNLQCLTAGSPGQIADLKVAGATTAIRLTAQKGGTIHLESKVSGNSWSAVDITLGLTLGAASRACLAQDGKVLTLSTLGKPEPNLYEMHWACKDASLAACSSWRVSPQQISVAAEANEIPKVAFSCVSTINSGVNKSVGAKSTIVFFWTGTDASSCMQPTGPTYKAEYVPRLAFPMLDPDKVDAGALSKCVVGLGPDGAQDQLQCRFRGKKGLKFVLRFSPTGDRDWESLSLELENGTKLVNSALFGSLIDRAGLDKNGDLVMSDARNFAWRLVLDPEAMRETLRARQCSSKTCPNGFLPIGISKLVRQNAGKN